ncbi:sulfite exporter TauE/SafE family protein [Agarivorans sp. 1_MG-2023]|uniref:sulfite exporter TauE/SafE family protein n=1 Tax=Agarivorans sp. 1_MG-2023 TaxID=3062634 RepID=UPI0026E158C7|nr:sulfite exporter TauE/SafE family protein [Agarivorans sp. 1_MG-2023]MDO6762287.1 sulfite exporter TauE/SafE family protein [Agarivorans sp. 1_MG-2023]
MILQTDYAAAFITGLLGATHCIAMCGGIACVLGSRVENSSSKFLVSVGFNLGRIVSYAIAGAIVSGSIQAIGQIHQSLHLLVGLQWLAALMLILLGIHLTRWWSVLTPLEAAGKVLWNRIQPSASKFLSLNHPLACVPLGLLWGWLPCGLVYSTLTLSASQASWQSGAAVMFSFGLGTFSVMLLSVMLGQKLSHLLNNRKLQIVSGLSVFALGIYQVVTLL